MASGPRPGGRPRWRCALSTTRREAKLQQAETERGQYAPKAAAELGALRRRGHPRGGALLRAARRHAQLRDAALGLAVTALRLELAVLRASTARCARALEGGAGGGGGQYTPLEDNSGNEVTEAARLAALDAQLCASPEGWPVANAVHAA